MAKFNGKKILICIRCLLADGGYYKVRCFLGLMRVFGWGIFAVESRDDGI